MIEGLHRSDVPYVWPASIRRGEGSRQVIYLDLNHWIGLAKADTGHRDGSRYTDLLAACRHAIQHRQVIFPLSGQHYMEMAGIRDPRQREDIARVMTDLSEFRTLLCRSLVMRLELEAVLDTHIGGRTIPYAPLNMIGTGVGHAFGISHQLQIRDQLDVLSETIRQNWPAGPDAYDRSLAEAQYIYEWMALRGPTDAELEDLVMNGFDAGAARRGQELRAQQEHDQASRFDQEPRWRRGRLRDVIGARYMNIELVDMLIEALADRQATLSDLVGDDRDAIRAVVDAMPSGDVHVSLQVAAHRNPQSSWTVNDFFDIDALALAVPYCDVVVTERRRARDLTWSGCPQRLDTTILTSPEELLESLPAS